ncbi:MAG TPA: hypothetical protein VFS39_11790 [Nitrospira sp.]|nr:hypothetical protein [Nitrospira sp.]
MSRAKFLRALPYLLAAAGCNSDVPVSATADLPWLGLSVTVTRTATHPFLARFNLRLRMMGPNRCVATAELFPDTGGVSRRNLYDDVQGRLILVSQFDVRVFDPQPCSLSLQEFRWLGSDMRYLGVFDSDEEQVWKFFPASVRTERAFERP